MTIADYLGVPRSDLFELTRYTSEYVRAIFKELWPRYEHQVDLSEQVAWQKVYEGREFKGQDGHEAIRGYVKLILEGLLPSTTNFFTSGCTYPDCECLSSGLRCDKTGWLLGPED